MSLHSSHCMQPKQSLFPNFQLKCFICDSDGNLRPLEAQNKYILVLLCPKLFCTAKPNTQYLICWDCEFMIVRIKQFQAKLIKTYVAREGVPTFQPAKGSKPANLSREIEPIEGPTQIVPANQPVLSESAEVKLEPEETIVIKIEKDECVDCYKLTQSSPQQGSSGDSTDTASEADILMNDDPLMTPIQKNNMKIVKKEEPPEKVLNNELVAPNVKLNNRPKKVIINIPNQKPAQAYRGPVNVTSRLPKLAPKKESVQNFAIGSGILVPVSLTDVAGVPITVKKNTGTILDVLKAKKSTLDIKKDKGSVSSRSESEDSIVITKIISSNPNPPKEQVAPDCGRRLGFYGDKEDEAKCKILSRNELKAYREKKASGIFKRCKYKCERCIELFNCQESLDEHNMKHDISRGTSLCEVCKQRFPDDNSRNEHYKQHFIIFECLKCQYQNYDRMVISEHIHRRHAVSSFYCKKCYAVFKTFNEKRRHILYVHSKKASCEECNKTFLSLSRLKSHMAKCHQLETTDCSICKKKVRKSYLAKHMRITHTDNGEVTAYCATCDKTFKSQQSYENHLKTTLKHNKVEQIGVKCDHCDKYFTNPLVLKNHIQEINGLKNKCDICNKEFKSKRILARHISVIHMGQKPRCKPNICEYCGKSYSIKASLDQHINTHLGRRPFVCKDCGATFMYSAALFTHRRLVHKVKRRYEMTDGE